MLNPLFQGERSDDLIQGTTFNDFRSSRTAALSKGRSCLACDQFGESALPVYG